MAKPYRNFTYGTRQDLVIFHRGARTNTIIIHLCYSNNECQAIGRVLPLRGIEIPVIYLLAGAPFLPLVLLYLQSVVGEGVELFNFANYLDKQELSL